MLKKVKKNNKGFTLIELLVVIVILGVLMIIAVPMVTKYIKQAKQDAFVDTAKNYINSARYGYLNGDYTNPVETCTTLDSGNGGTIYIKFRYIEVEKTGGKSSFNKTIKQDESYVKIESTKNGQYTYSVYMLDSGGNVIKLTKESDLTRTSVTTESSSDGSGSGFDEKKACVHDTYDATP